MAPRSERGSDLRKGIDNNCLPPPAGTRRTKTVHPVFSGIGQCEELRTRHPARYRCDPSLCSGPAASDSKNVSDPNRDAETKSGLREAEPQEGTASVQSSAVRGPERGAPATRVLAASWGPEPTRPRAAAVGAAGAASRSPRPGSSRRGPERRPRLQGPCSALRPGRRPLPPLTAGTGPGRAPRPGRC